MYDMLNSQYFNELSSNIKERVWNCGLIFNAENVLRQYVSNLQDSTLTTTLNYDENKLH